jgi:MYXO-CTERM domain-containing protein
MDLFLATCQGIGLALAVGTLGGALAGGAPRRGLTPSPLVTVLLVVSGLAGAFLFGASLASADHPAWPGWWVGAFLAVFSFATIRGVVAGAIERAPGQGSQAGIAGFLAIGALVLAGLSLLPTSPIALVALAALAYLAFARRRQAQLKHEGLRSLR